MALKSMETAEEAIASMEKAPRALPRPGRVPEQRLLSPEICQWRAAELKNSFSKIIDRFRVFCLEAFYR
jgi:hypothetical protein